MCRSQWTPCSMCSDSECFMTNFCDLSNRCRDRRQLGDSCHNNLPCAAGLSCNNQTNRCVLDGQSKKAQLRQDCSVTSDCAAPLYCSQKKCVPRVFYGQKCESDEMCRGWLFCSPDKVCKTLRQFGETCDDRTDKCWWDYTCGANKKCVKKG